MCRLPANEPRTGARRGPSLDAAPPGLLEPDFGLAQPLDDWNSASYPYPLPLLDAVNTENVDDEELPAEFLDLFAQDDPVDCQPAVSRAPLLGVKPDPVGGAVSSSLGWPVGMGGLFSAPDPARYLQHLGPAAMQAGGAPLPFLQQHAIQQPTMQKPATQQPATQQPATQQPVLMQQEQEPAATPATAAPAPRPSGRRRNKTAEEIEAQIERVKKRRRESAQRSRQRKTGQMKSLEVENAELRQENAELRMLLLKFGGSWPPQQQQQQQATSGSAHTLHASHSSGDVSRCVSRCV